MVKKILITGGAVHCHLDAVKMLTNRFKGGRIAELASKLFERNNDIVYLCAKGSVLPEEEGLDENMEIVYHNGFEDYREKVKEIAPNVDAVILGAAVCNLIPVNPWKGKFPSHNYKVGDIIPIDFTIAPRVVDEVKSVMKRSAHLFAFKLLKDVEHEELVEAAYEIVLDSKATCVFANDANNLDIKYAITKERSAIKLVGNEYTDFILDCMEDEYYRSKVCKGGPLDPDTVTRAKEILKIYEDVFKEKHGKKGYIFGTVVVRDGDSNAFLTTARGKTILNAFAFVNDVDHEICVVETAGCKASLNAPLMHRILEQHPKVKSIVHYHASGKDFKDVPVLPYAIPGTVRDTMRKIDSYMFEIENHGMFICFE